MGSDLPNLDSIDIGGKGPFQELPLSGLQGAIVPVIVVSKHRVSLIGTAFNIAPHGLFVTAKHVMEEALALCAGDPGSGVFILWMASGVGHDVPDLVGGAIPILLFSINDHHDVGILQPAQLHEGDTSVTFPTLALDTRTPNVGTHVLGIGFTRMMIEGDHRLSTERHIRLTQSLHASHGQVAAAHPRGRDAFMMPFPAIETSARFDPGMSGGPVFAGDSGKVCGVVCSGLSDPSDEGTFTSYASMIVNALVLDVRLNSQSNELASVFDLVLHGHVIADDAFNRLSIVIDDKGERHIQFPGPSA